MKLLSLAPEYQTAIVIHQFGEADVLTINQNEKIPDIQASQVLIKTAYAGLNPIDYKTRQGKGWAAQAIKQQQFAQHQPAILGFDVAGEVVQSGDSRFKIGDKVAALTFKGGCYAQYVAVDADLLALIPDNVPLSVAGALPCAGVTAKQFFDFMNIKPKQKVVMNAPAGGVGHLLLQLLLQQDIELSLVASTDKKDKLANWIDVSAVHQWLDYQHLEDFPDLQADVLIDLVGGEAGKKALSMIKQGGLVFVLPTIWVDELQQAGKAKQLTVQGFIAKPNAIDLSEMMSRIANQDLSLHIEQKYEMTQAQAAHQSLQQGKAFGKLIFSMS